MGVDYRGVGGIGIKITDELVKTMIKAGVFSQEDADDDLSWCIEELGFEYRAAGSCYTGAITKYLLVEGKTLEDVYINSVEFCTNLEKIGIDILPEELQVISDLYIY